MEGEGRKDVATPFQKMSSRQEQSIGVLLFSMLCSHMLMTGIQLLH